MKLYLLEQDENQSEGSIVSCVVVASSKENAQNNVNNVVCLHRCYS